MVNTQQAWENILVGIQGEISKANFNTWFKNTFISSADKHTMTVGVPNEFIREWLSTKYDKLVLKAVRLVLPEVRSVAFSVTKRKDPVEISQNSPKDLITKRAAAETLRNNQEARVQKLPLAQHYVNTQTNLNARYTFDSFIIGSFNELAYSAARAIIQKPGVYNPFFIYGETGLGKTHLIQAIGNALMAQNPRLRVFYTNSEKFTMDLVSALQKNSIDSFKKKYRNLDVLIIDDIQFISGKEKTQEELFHLFNILHDGQKQIIFSSDKHPNYIIGLEERLKSRFSAGMIVDVNKPEYESRLAIIKTKLVKLEYKLSETATDYIARNIEGNVREIEGILNSLMCQAQIKDRALSLEDVKRLVKNTSKAHKQVSIADVARVVAQFYNIEVSLVYEKTRRKEVVKTRQITMYILREDFSISFPHIGRELGGRDHTTVIHSCTKIKNELETSPTLVHELEQIRDMIKTY